MPKKYAKQVSSLWNQYRKFNDRFYFNFLAQLSICFRRPARKWLSIIYCISPSPITLNRSWEFLNDFLKDFLNDFHNKFLISQFLRLSLTQKALHLPFWFFFSFLPSCQLFWTDYQKLFIQFFIMCYQESVWPRSDSFLGHTKYYFCKKCFSSCYSWRVWHMARLMYGNQHL